MFCFLINKKKINIFKKRPTDYNPRSIWIETVQNCSTTGPANIVRPLG